MKSFNPWVKLMGAIVLVIIGLITIFAAAIPIVWIGAFIWAIGLAASGFKQWDEIKNLDKPNIHNQQYKGNPKNESKYFDKEDTMANTRVDQELTVSPREAADGAKKVLTIKGRRLEVLIPAGIKTGTIMRLRNALDYGDTIIIRITVEIEGEAVDGKIHRVTPVRPVSYKRSFPTWAKLAIGVVMLVAVSSLIMVIKSNTSPSSTSVRLSTGTYLVNNMVGGDGELTVKNGLNLDSVALLSRVEAPKAPLSAVYIQAGSSHTIKGISDGVYVLFFSYGTDWDNDLKKFVGKTTYERFEDKFDFITTSAQYTTYEVTLNPVIGGTADTQHLSENEFPALVTPPK